MNPLKSNYEYQDHLIPLRKAKYGLLVYLLELNGYSATRFAILEPLCDQQFQDLECRKAQWVQYYTDVLFADVDLDTVPDINDCDITIGVTPEAQGEFAFLETNLTGATNNDLRFQALQRGVLGNLISITYVVSGNNTPLGVTVSGNDINVQVATGAGGAATSTAAQVKTAVDVHPQAHLLVSVANKTGNTGAGIVAALSKTYLAGGSDT